MIGSGRTFAVVTKDNVRSPMFSFGHEIGHMYGCQHNREAPVSKKELYSYGYGKLFAKGFRTIMR
jgi:hypothetical protein